jgi:hypothetical protein
MTLGISEPPLDKVHGNHFISALRLILRSFENNAAVYRSSHVPAHHL